MPVHDWTKVISGIFHDFHQRWIVQVATVLNDGLLPEGFYALAEQVAEGPEPDVLALETSRTFPVGDDGSKPSADSAVALADYPPQVTYTESDEREIYARKADRVAVYHASGDRVVAFVEIVSPGNKHSQFAFNKFLEKLEDSLTSGIHLLVVDLHPPGRWDPRGLHAAFWERRMGSAHGVTAEQRLGLSAYRSDVHPTAYFEPIAVGDELPDMPIFLTPDYYINCPLESTYMAAWRGVPKRWKDVIVAENDTKQSIRDN